MTKSKSEEFLEKKSGGPPSVTWNMAKSVSQQRREELEKQVERGEFKEEGSSNKPTRFQNQNILTAAGNVTSSSLKKTAQFSTNTNPSAGAQGSGGNSYRGPGGTVRQTPEVYSPLWLNSNLNLPRDRATINAWCRSFFALNPIVQNALALHSTYPISKLNIKCKNKKVEDFFNAMAEEIDLMNVCVSIAQEYFVLGEAFVYGELDEKSQKWSRLLLQNPDYITVKRSVIAGEPIISLRPDENLRRIVFSNRPSDVQQRKQLDQSIIEHVKRGENIPLNNFYVSHLARRISPYEIRGTSLIVSVFRQLMLFDKLYESKFAQADNLINPITVVKVGGPEYKPTPTDLEQWRQVFEEAQYDKDFKIFTHEAVTIERVGASGGIYDISGDIDKLVKFIYIGLMVPSVLMDGGSDVTYANGGVALDVLRQRYMQFRNMLTAWLKRKIFAPISKINEFYEYVDGKKQLIIPDVDWNHMSLFDLNDYIQAIAQLATGEPKKVSLHTLYRSLGLEWEDEVRKIRKEDIAEAIRNKEKEALNQMPLNELRAITDESEINEVVQPPVPGESPYEQGGAPGSPGGGPGPIPSPPGGGGPPPGGPPA